MATQGIVSVRENGIVVMKVVAGCDGYNAQKLADKLRNNWPVDIDRARQMAMDSQFGDPDCLVVMTKSDIRNGHGIGDEIGRRYRKTFRIPEFNPRWSRGTADYIVVIDV